jgi:lipid A ethanolaminephosphotransferase
VADASATYTAAGVKAILEYKDTDELYEILPNYLYRTGVDVFWRTSNWGEPPVHVRSYETIGDLRKRLPETSGKYDGDLIVGLEEEFAKAGQVFGVLHTYTNHGPSYNTNYPPEFEVFTPVSSTVEMSKVSREELFNAYDNSVVYTDWIIHSVIETVRELGVRGCVLFVSDHGESLGENNLYMHGVPMSMAPREQLEIPFVVWTTESSRLKDLDKVGQHHVFHSVLDFFGVESPVFDESLSVFE